MNTLIKKIILYLLPVLMVFVLIELFYRLVPNDYVAKYTAIPKKYTTTKTLIFGNSHTYYGLNPNYFNQATFNLAYISQPIYIDKLLFDSYINNFSNLKCVILHIEYTSLSEVVNTKENNWRKYYYQTYMKLEVPSINKYDCTKYFLSSTKNFNTNTKLFLNYLKNGTLITCDKNGFGINYTKANRVAFSRKDAQQRIKNIEDNLMNFDDNSIRIQSIIDTCKKRNIKVVLLNMPVSKYFSEGVNQIKLKKIQETCSAIAKKNYNVSYLNLFKDKRFTNEDFFDADHLHTDGAIKCSKIVNTYINTIYKQENTANFNSVPYLSQQTFPKINSQNQ